MRARLILLPTLLALALLTATIGNAAELTIDPQRQWQYARELLDNRQYRRAAEEFQRFAFFFPGHPDRRRALLDAGKAFLQARDPQSAQTQFKALIADDRLDPLAIEGHFLFAESYLQMGAPTHAVVRLNNLIALSDDPATEDRAYYRIGWIHIEATDWQGALRAFGRISPAGRQRHDIPALTASLTRSQEIPQKSPALAGTLSIIPGGGQLYCRRYKDAAVAFVLSVGTFWAAQDAFDNDQNALGGLLALVGAGFYAGNIYGAVNDAHKFNAHQKQQYVDHLQRNYTLRIDMPPLASRERMFIGLQFSF